MPVAVIYSPKMADRIAGVIIKRMCTKGQRSADLVWAMGDALKRCPPLDALVAERVKKFRDSLKRK